jgi:hypothetical protein
MAEEGKCVVISRLNVDQKKMIFTAGISAK